MRISYRDAFRPCSRVSSGEKNNTYLNMQRYKTATKNEETKISSNLESLNFQTCNDTKLQLPNLQIRKIKVFAESLKTDVFFRRKLGEDQKN